MDNNYNRDEAAAHSHHGYSVHGHDHETGHSEYWLCSFDGGNCQSLLPQRQGCGHHSGGDLQEREELQNCARHPDPGVPGQKRKQKLPPGCE